LNATKKPQLAVYVKGEKEVEGQTNVLPNCAAEELLQFGIDKTIARVRGVARSEKPKRAWGKARRSEAKGRRE